ncbi:HAD family hydrolase [Streptomyces sp. JNUCC 64]
MDARRPALPSGEPAPPPELVIFDCDGVLVDSEPIALENDAAALAALGWRLSRAEIIERFLGRPDSYLAEQVEAHLGHPLPPDWLAEHQRRFQTAVDDLLRPVAGITEALDALTVPSCVASSSSHPRLRRTLRLTGLHGRFRGRVFSGDDVERPKPAPDLFRHAAAVLGVEPRRCVVVEDSQYGVAAARAAGMRVLGYSGGLTPAAWLRGPGTVVFDDMRELPGLIGPGTYGGGS